MSLGIRGVLMKRTILRVLRSLYESNDSTFPPSLNFLGLDLEFRESESKGDGTPLSTEEGKRSYQASSVCDTFERKLVLGYYLC